MPVGSKSAKRHWWLDCPFALLGSASVKDACKTLLQLATGLQNVEKFIIN